MRLVARAKGGFYPAPPEAVALAAGFQKTMHGGQPTLLDPCCGKGTAIKQLAEMLDCPMTNVYAIELDEGRAAEAKANLEGANVIGPASFFWRGVFARQHVALLVQPAIRR